MIWSRFPPALFALPSLFTTQVIHELHGKDPQSRGHIIRLHAAFDYMGHRCLVFDSYSKSLRKVT